MRVVQATEFGDPEVLKAGEAPDPVAGPGQVVVEVEAVDVLTLDSHIRRGLRRGFFRVEPPYVPGNGVGGRVLAVGAGVEPRLVGRRVVARTGRGVDGERTAPPVGAYAELAVVRARELFPVPDGLGPREAAALLHDGPIAIALAEAARLKPGQWVLVSAAAGGGGSLLVQLARRAGARVVAAARGRRKLDAVRELGAEAAVDYSEAGWPGRVREATGGAGAEVVFDGTGGPLGRAALEAAADGGRFFAWGSASGDFSGIDPQAAERRGITVVTLFEVSPAPERLRRLTEQALAEAAAGRIRPVIGQTFPLERAADAHAAIEAREAVGKTLLLP